MTTLKVFSDTNTEQALLETSAAATITSELAAVGVRFEQWPIRDDIRAGATQDSILAAYATEVSKLIDDEGYQTVDVISLRSDNPAKAELRQKFLAEHIHTEDEVRFFVDGQGLFAMHIGDQVFEICCERGDLLSVPANTLHWFDLGPNPELAAIRFFNNPDGWVAHYSGNDIAERFSRLEN